MKTKWEALVTRQVEDGKVVYYVGVAGFGYLNDEEFNFCEGFGDTFEEAYKAAEDIVSLHLAEYDDEGWEYPSNKVDEALLEGDNQYVVVVFGDADAVERIK